MKKPHHLAGFIPTNILHVYQAALHLPALPCHDPASQLGLDLAKMAARDQE